MMSPDAFDTTTIRTLPVPLLLVDGGDAGIRSINRAASSATGYDSDVQDGLSLLSIFPRVSPLELARLLDATITGNRPPQQWLLRRPDGSVAFTEVLITRHDSRNRNEWVFALRDPSRENGATDGLEGLREGIKDLHEAIVVARVLSETDPKLGGLFVNAAFEALTGWTNDEFIAAPYGVLYGSETSADTVRRVRVAVAAGEPVRTELQLYRRDGSTFWSEIDAIPILGDDARISHWIVNHRDVTARRRLEEQIFRTQKLDAVGRLASGVAHDFNNVLTAIGGFAELLLNDLPRASSQHDEALQIKLGADRAVALTRQLLVFSREETARPAHLDLNRVITDVERLLRRVISEHVSIQSVLTTPLPAVLADRNQIEQVLLNLVMNASEAMPEGGTVTIETRTLDVDASKTAEFAEVSPGRYVVLAVTDRGVGMTADTRERMFVPFFTTKPSGSGLGLSVVQGIVRRNGGHVLVDSEIGSGSCFRVLLAVTGDSPDAITEHQHADVVGGSETILVVEDDAAVRQVTRVMLVRRGYTVLVAHDAEEAERVAKEHAGVIDLLLCDVVLPRRSGQYVAERLLVRRPRLRVLFMSGYSEDVILDQHILAQGRVMLAKPFSDISLATRVRAALDHRE